MDIKRFWGFSFLAAPLLTTMLFAAKSPAPVSVQLDVVSTSPVVTVHLHFTNTSSHDVFLTKAQACALGDARNVFNITQNGQKIRYTGALEKVKAKFPADYLQLAPKSSYDVTTVLTQYAFLPGEQTYSLQYMTDLWDKTQKHRFVLTSNSVPVTEKRQSY